MKTTLSPSAIRRLAKQCRRSWKRSFGSPSRASSAFVTAAAKATAGDVTEVHWLPGERRDDRVARAAVSRSELVLAKELGEGRHQDDITQRLRGLRRRDRQARHAVTHLRHFASGRRSQQTSPSQAAAFEQRLQNVREQRAAVRTRGSRAHMAFRGVSRAHTPPAGAPAVITDADVHASRLAELESRATLASAQRRVVHASTTDEPSWRSRCVGRTARRCRSTRPRNDHGAHRCRRSPPVSTVELGREEKRRRLQISFALRNSRFSRSSSFSRARSSRAHTSPAALVDLNTPHPAPQRL